MGTLRKGTLTERSCREGAALGVWRRSYAAPGVVAAERRRMAAPYHHAVSAAREWGGVPEDYLDIHAWFDETKQVLPDQRHRAVRHHETGVFEAERIFGSAITNSDGRTIPVRWIGERHVREDLGFIPTVANWLQGMPLERWMTRARPLSRELDGEEGSA